MVALAATLIACSSALGLQRKEGLHPFNQLAGWSLLSKSHMSSTAYMR